jgi:hypothetical protein
MPCFLAVAVFVVLCSLLVPGGWAQQGKAPALTIRYDTACGPHAFLCSDHVHDSVFIVDANGAVRWQYTVSHPQDVWMLPSGNVLISWYQGVREVTRDKQIVWEYTTPRPNEIPNCQPLFEGPGGELSGVMIGVVGECRLVEVDRAIMLQVAEGRPQEEAITRVVRLSTPVAEPHAQFRMCRKTPEGTYLVPFTAESALREVNASGEVIREFPSEGMPVAALRLANGNTLVDGGGAVTEYDAAGVVVWKLTQADVPGIGIAVPAGLLRLPNGNTVVCNWNASDTPERVGAHLFEVTPDKRVVWQVSGTQLSQVAACQLLTDDLLPRDDGTVK